MVYPELRCRRYGHQEWEKFDTNPSGEASIASGNIGKVEVDCKFRFRESQWGVLSKAKTPAGIIYFDICFHQPSGYCLKDATVTIRLDVEHQELRRDRREQKKPPEPIKVLYGEYFGPEEFDGSTQHALKTRNMSLKPEIGAAGAANIGGMGGEIEDQRKIKGCWKFKGNKWADRNSKDSSTMYRVLTWYLEETNLEKQPSHMDTVHTAFSVLHDGLPFLMHVNIEGRLRNRLSNGAETLRKNFKFGSKRSDPIAMTMIDPGGIGRFTLPLDEVGRSLEASMCLKNSTKVAVVKPAADRTISEAVPATEQMAPETSSITEGEVDHHDWSQAIQQNLPCPQGSTGAAPVRSNPPEGSPSGAESNEYRAPCENLKKMFFTLSTPHDAKHFNGQSGFSSNSEAYRQARRAEPLIEDSQQGFNRPRARSSITCIGDETMHVDFGTTWKQLSTDIPSPKSVRNIP